MQPLQPTLLDSSQPTVICDRNFPLGEQGQVPVEASGVPLEELSQHYEAGAIALADDLQ